MIGLTMDGMTDELQVLSVCLFWFRKLRRGGGGEGRGGEGEYDRGGGGGGVKSVNSSRIYFTTYINRYSVFQIIA